jgi:DNA ligase-1
LDVEDFILDGEVMAFQNGKPLHFQELQKRLHKKNLTDEFMTEIPLAYVVYVCKLRKLFCYI